MLTFPYRRHPIFADMMAMQEGLLRSFLCCLGPSLSCLSAVSTILHAPVGGFYLVLRVFMASAHLGGVVVP